MPHKILTTATIVIVAVLIIGLGIGTFLYCRSTNAEIQACRQEIARSEIALAAARQEARDQVRAKLRKEEKKVARENAEESVRRKRAAQMRRASMRRFFGARGFTPSASYAQAAKLPTEPPTEDAQEIIDLAGEAASEDDLDTAAEVLETALKAEDPRARLAAVEMLSGLGDAGLVDISEFLQDPHPEVANLAADRWELGIQNLTDPAEQASLTKVGFLAITDTDQLRALGGTLMLVPDAKLAVDVLTEVIREGIAVQRTAAKEAYESVTGEKWVDEKTALAWLEANYEPPEPEIEDEAGAQETDEADADSDEF